MCNGKGKTAGRKPDTFAFLGFTHICAQSRKGMLTVHVRTMSKRLRRGLNEIAKWCQAHRHDPVDEQQKTLTPSSAATTSIADDLRTIGGF
jgi:hypothetical protein